MNSVVTTFVNVFGFEEFFAECRFDPTRSQIEGLKAWLSDTSRIEDDLLLIYHTGHGHLCGKNSNEHRLILSETVQDQELSTGLDPLFWKDSFADSKVKHVWMILDVCHAGAVAREIGELTRHLEDTTNKNEPTGKSIYLTLACRESQNSWVGRLPQAICEAVKALQTSDFGSGGIIEHGAFVRKVNTHGCASQEVSPIGGGEFPAFLELDVWKAYRKRVSEFAIVSVTHAFYRNEAGKLRKLCDDGGILWERLRENDRIRLTVTLNKPGYLLLVWVDSEGNAHSLYPWSDSQWSLPEHPLQSSEMFLWPLHDPNTDPNHHTTVEITGPTPPAEALFADTIYAFARETPFTNDELKFWQHAFETLPTEAQITDIPENTPSGPYLSELTLKPPSFSLGVRAGPRNIQSLPTLVTVVHDPATCRHLLVERAFNEIPISVLPRFAITFVAIPLNPHDS